MVYLMFGLLGFFLLCILITGKSFFFIFRRGYLERVIYETALNSSMMFLNKYNVRICFVMWKVANRYHSVKTHK